jgi:hypothetical protein
MRHAQKTELFTLVVAVLGHEKMVDVVVLGPKPKAQSPKPKAQSPKPKAQSPKPKAQSPKPKAQSPTPNAQRPTPNAQRPTHNAQRTASFCMGAAAMASRQAQRLRVEGCPAARSAAACLHTTEVSAWWSCWCNPGALEGGSAVAAGCLGLSFAVGSCRSLGRLPGSSTAPWCVVPIALGAACPPAGLEAWPRGHASMGLSDGFSAPARLARRGWGPGDFALQHRS